MAGFLLRLRVHSQHLAASNMGSRSPGAREHLLRGQFEQYSLGTHEYLPQHNGMVALWYNTFWSASRMLNHHVHIRSPRHRTYVCKKLWLDEPHWSRHTIDIPMLSAVVREPVRTRARQLFDTRFASRLSGD